MLPQDFLLKQEFQHPFTIFGNTYLQVVKNLKRIQKLECFRLLLILCHLEIKIKSESLLFKEHLHERFLDFHLTRQEVKITRLSRSMLDTEQPYIQRSWVLLILTSAVSSFTLLSNSTQVQLYERTYKQTFYFLSDSSKRTGALTTMYGEIGTTIYSEIPCVIVAFSLSLFQVFSVSSSHSTGDDWRGGGVRLSSSRAEKPCHGEGSSLMVQSQPTQSL